MANPEHLDILKQGIGIWNDWREKNAEIKPDLAREDLHFARLIHANLRSANLGGAYLLGAYLREANLVEADLRKATLRGARLGGAKLGGANLWEANLINTDIRGADLQGADLRGADLIKANLRGANLSGALLSFANLREANLMDADLHGAQLVETILIETNLERTNLSGCRIFGISVWKLKGIPKDQSNLNLADWNEPAITVDNLEVAQFIYLLLNNEKIRDVINTITTKVVLILGRFGDHKTVLDAIRDELRKRDYLPVLFDFGKPTARNVTETVRTLAHLSRFIIADITDPSSIPQELYAIIPTLAVAVQPVLESGKHEYSMFVDLRTTYHWVLPIHEYKDTKDLLASLGDKVIAPAEAKAKELEKR